MPRLRVADYIVERLHALGVDTAFLVTGGGAMHLNDAIGKSEDLRKVYSHHEQAAAMAAEVYARIADKPALLNVTTGPGSINALNGVFGAYTDSIPIIVVSGQVKRETLRSFHSIPGLRQLGDQEVDIVSMATGITKFVHLLLNENEIVDILDRAFVEATTGRPGPVWIDIPVDVQGTYIDVADGVIERPLHYPLGVGDAKKLTTLASTVLDMIEVSNRPVLFGGSGVRIGKAINAFTTFAETHHLPIVTAWTHDLVSSDHPLFMGRPGTIGTRAGNFVVQNSDLVLIIGSRLNIRQVSYNWSSFARNAKKIWVDIDPAEFKKPFVKADLEIIADAKAFLEALNAEASRRIKRKAFDKWVDWCRSIKMQYTPNIKDYPVSVDRINAYHFVAELFDQLAEGDIVVCGDATATIVPYQIGHLKPNMRLISNSGSASMGHDIPGAVGAIVANPDARVICLAGDGSSMMNIQELQTLKQLNGNVKIFILDNDGYLSIKQTQRNFFGREAGSSAESGLSMPDFEKLGQGFGLPSYRIGKGGWKEKLKHVLSQLGPVLAVVELDLVQEFEPRLKSKMENGVITTPELDDMHPFMAVNVIDAIRSSATKI
jgi:acetolactate synthase-1/2/3 large subunit